jgi:hypothetical protein
MEHAIDFDFRDGAARHGRQQNATERVAECVAKTALERLDHDFRLTSSGGRHFDDTRLQEFANGCLHGKYTCLCAE